LLNIIKNREDEGMTCIHRVAPALLIVASLAIPAAAQQTTVTQSDIQRLQDNIYLADRDISTLRTRDSALASQLTTQLDDLRDEVVYLKVKLRKTQLVTRNEYSDVRDRIEDVRSRARGESSPSTSSNGGSFGSGSGGGLGSGAGSVPRPSAPPRTSSRDTIGIATGTEFDVRLQSALNSGTAQVEDRFEATTLTDVVSDGRVAIPSGSVVRGVVTAVEPATRTNRTAKMTVSFDRVTINGRDYPMRGTVTQAIEGEGIKGDLPKAGAGAAVGGILGAVLGGGKGAVLGAIIGGGGTIAATEGKELDLPQGSTLRVRLDSPLDVSTAR
jgi:hypothetical protein